MMRVGLRRRAVALGLAVLLGLGGAVESVACPICFAFPKKTDADFLLEGRCVVLARPDPQDPFKYVPTAVLKGAYDDSDFDLLVDSATRRLMQVHADRHVLLVQDARGGAWQNLGPISPEFAKFAERLMAVGATWHGADAATLRWQFFQPWFGHADERIRTLAYLEMGRAPYAVVRRLGRFVPRETYAAILEERQYIEWRGLAILLLAQSEVAADRQRILDSFQAAKEFGLVTNLAAWTAAALEIDLQGTLDQIEQGYFGSAERTPNELEAIWRALSMHGSQGKPELRDRIVDCYRKLLARAPQLAPQVAEDLRVWKRSELTETLAVILQRPHDFEFAEVQVIQRYVRETAAAKSAGLAHD